MYVTIEKSTLNLIGLADSAYEDADFINVAAPIDFSFNTYYADENFTLQPKNDLDYIISSGTLTINSVPVIDTLKISILTPPNQSLELDTEPVAVYTLDLSTTTTLDLSNYLGYIMQINSRKYKTVMDTIV